MYITKHQYRRLSQNEADVKTHDFAFCPYLNSEFFDNKTGESTSNSGLIEIDADDVELQSHAYTKCSWCNRFQKLSSENQLKYLELKKKLSDSPSSYNDIQLRVFRHIYGV